MVNPALSGGLNFKIKHSSRFLLKSKFVDWGGQACRLGWEGPPVAPVLYLKLHLCTGRPTSTSTVSAMYFGLILLFLGVVD